MHRLTTCVTVSHVIRFGAFTCADLGVHVADPGVHVPDLGVHITAIRVFT